MGLFGWLKKQSDGGGNSEARAWRDAWAAAVASLDAAAIGPLEAALRRTPPFADDLEIEEEMLDGLRHLVALAAELEAGRLPIVETTHRVVGRDRCHFSAPVSMPDESTQPSGRLILTNVRAIFAGGGKATTIPWHAVADVLHSERDVILVRRDRESLHRFRCNVYADALEAVWLARALANGRRRSQP